MLSRRSSTTSSMTLSSLTPMILFIEEKKLVIDKKTIRQTAMNIKILDVEGIGGVFIIHV